MSGNNWFHGGLRVLWAAALTIGCGAAASAGTVIIDANTAYPGGSGGVYGDSLTKTDTNSYTWFGTTYYTGEKALSGPAGNPNPSGWSYTEIATSSTVGINTTYARDGNGSAYFNITGTSVTGPGKGNVKLSNSSGLGGTLGELSSLGYDWYRDKSSTTGAIQVPVLRLYLQGGTTLIYEMANNGANTGAADWSNTWHSIDAIGGKFWYKNDGTGQTGATISSMTSLLSKNVIGVEVGVGSGWNGTFLGAADNLTIGFTKNGVATSTTYNFEVSGAPVTPGGSGTVPEPASVAMGLIAGVAGLAVAARRRRSA